MPTHHSHRMVAYKHADGLWACFCEWCGESDDCGKDNNLEKECSKRYKSIDSKQCKDYVLNIGNDPELRQKV